MLLYELIWCSLLACTSHTHPLCAFALQVFLPDDKLKWWHHHDRSHHEHWLSKFFGQPCNGELFVKQSINMAGEYLEGYSPRKSTIKSDCIQCLNARPCELFVSKKSYCVCFALQLPSTRHAWMELHGLAILTQMS